MTPRLAWMVSIVLALALAACTRGASQAPAAAADPMQGHMLAERWCSECHRVSPKDASGARAGHILSPPVVAPDFAAVARKPYADRAYLEGFMGELHLPMPIYRLSDAERADLVAYIMTLR